MSATLDSAWVRWVSRREPQAFEELVRQYAAMVYGTCLRVLRNPTDAEDVAQECFEELVRKPDLSGVRVPGAWLHGTATYRSLTRLRSDERRKQREIAYAEDLASTTPPTREELADCVDECIAELPEETRFLLVQYFLCGRTQHDIARELGIPRRTLGHRIESGLNLLGAAMRKRGVVVEAVVLTGLLAALSSSASAAPQTLMAALGKLAMAQSVRSAAMPAAASSSMLASLKLPAIIAALCIVALAGVLGYTYKSAPQATDISTNAATASGGISNTRNTDTPASTATAPQAEKAAEPAAPTAELSNVTVSGFAVDEDNLPATDVRIGLQRKGLFGPTAENAVPVDGEGKFVWTGPLPETYEGNPPGEYTLYYCSDTVANADRSNLIYGRMQILAVESPSLKLTPGQSAEGVRVVVPSKRYAIEGKVCDAQGKGIAGVGLTIFSGLPNGQTLSDGQGNFRFARLYPYGALNPKAVGDHPNEWFSINVTHPDYDTPGDVNVRLGAKNVQIVLPEKKRGWISGTVVDEKTGAPLVGTKVWVSKVLRSDGVDMYWSSEESGEFLENGKFTLKDIPEGKAEVWASAPGCGPVCENVDVQTGQGTEGIALVLNKGGKVVFSLGDIPEGCPAQLEYAYAYQPEKDATINFRGKDQDNGSYTIDLAPGQYTVVAVVQVYGRYCYAQQVTVESGETLNLEAGPVGLARVKGTITPPPGNPRLSFVLRFGEQTTPVSQKYANTFPYRKGGWYLDLVKDGIFACAHCKTDYELGWLQPGTYTLTILSFDDVTEEFTQTSKTFTLGENEESTLDIAF
ncbi:MAG: sigma-70 family RNA polymerase sigma factor [Candidatus Hydrogenedentes bacterium]|nr:sigma-70 family RNA polymerase sigma factor [Candidatus Hydrogenedentota bacterium]